MNPEKADTKSRKNEVIGVILIGLGVLSAVSVYFGVDSIFGTVVHNVVFGFGGVLGYLEPVILLLWGLMWIAARGRVLNRRKQLLLLLALLMVFTMCHLAATDRLAAAGQSYGAFLADSYTLGIVDMSGGGILGALIAYWLHLLLGTIGSWVVCICALTACLILLTNLSLRRLGAELGTAVRTGYQDITAKTGELRQERERRRQEHRRERLYVESLRAERGGAAAPANDPFDLRIQSPERKSRSSRRKKNPGPRPSLATSGGSLDLQVFAPRTQRSAPETYRIEPVSAPEHDPDPYREVFADEDISFDDAPMPETRRRRRIDPKTAGLPWESETGLQIESAVKTARADGESVRAASAAASAGRQTVAAGGPRSGQPVPAPAGEPPAESAAGGGAYHVETGQHRAGTAAVVAADAAEGPADRSGTYRYPPLDLLDPLPGPARRDDSVQQKALRLEQTLASFNIDAHVVDILQGPVVTRYELQPAPGIKVSKIVQLSDNIALSLAAKSIRMEAPVPGKSVIGIEIPNEQRDTVGLRELLADPKFAAMKSPVAFALGKDITGTNVFADIAKMPHLLIAGQTGSGKSVCVNSLVVSLLYHASPDEVNLLMIDPKVVELSVFNNVPHLIAPVVTDPKKASLALNWGVAEMENRYKDFAKRNVKELSRYNEVLEADGEKKLPHVVVIVDELADLMMTSGQEVEEAITRIAQKGRAAGIHLVLATQRPTVNVVTGLIKANVPARVALSVKSSRDSMTILDSVGAEKLLGYGDMLFYTTGLANPERIQGCWVSDKEVEKVAEYLYTPPEELYNAAVQESIEDGGGSAADGADDRDPLFRRAAEVVVENEQASTSLLQRRLKVGYSRAARLIDQLESEGIVSGQNGSKARQVLISQEDLDNMYGGSRPE